MTDERLAPEIEQAITDIEVAVLEYGRAVGDLVRDYGLHDRIPDTRAAVVAKVREALAAAEARGRETARPLVARLLHRIQEEPRFAWYLSGPTETYSLLLMLGAALSGQPVDEFRRSFEATGWTTDAPSSEGRAEP